MSHLWQGQIPFRLRSGNPAGAIPCGMAAGPRIGGYGFIKLELAKKRQLSASTTNDETLSLK